MEYIMLVGNLERMEVGRREEVERKFKGRDLCRVIYGGRLSRALCYESDSLSLFHQLPYRLVQHPASARRHLVSR